MNRVFKLIIFVSILYLHTDISAQKGYELGGWLGTSFYFGDLNTTSSLQSPGLALGISGRKIFNTRVAARTTLSFARVQANDANSSNNFEFNRNLSFRSNIFDWTNVLEFNFFKFENGSLEFNKTPYIFGGFNIFHFNPTAVLDDQRYSLRNLGTEGQQSGQEYSRISGGLVLGAGFKWNINRLWSINFDVSNRFLFTDYLDDVSTVFPDKDALLANRGAIAVALSDRSLIDGLGDAGRQRGDTKGKDQYAFVGISVMRYFGGIECPVISQPKWK